MTKVSFRAFFTYDNRASLSLHSVLFFQLMLVACEENDAVTTRSARIPDSGFTVRQYATTGLIRGQI
jgi:hypothetical protein